MPHEGLTRANICEAVASKSPHVTKQLARSILDAMLDEIAAALINGDVVKIRNFGNFVVRDKKERAGRNPRTLAAAAISARRSLSFKAAPALKKQIARKSTGD